MDGVCVVVESRDCSGDSTSCSGIKMNKNFILTHCCIVWTLIEKYLEEKHFDNPVNNALHIEKSLASFIKSVKVSYRVITSAKSYPSRESKLESNANKNIVEFLNATFEYLVIPPILLNGLFQLLSKDEWNFFTKDQEKAICESKANQSMKVMDTLKNVLYLSTFIVLKIEDDNFVDCLQKFEAITSVPHKGEYIFLEGSPFGSNAPTLLLNSISQGIVGNIVPDGHLFITDARCTVGCEGGPAYSRGSSLKVCGIILSPNCSLTGNWVGLTFVASIRPLLAYMKKCTLGEVSEETVVTAACDSQLVDYAWLRTDSTFIGYSFMTSNVVRIMELAIVRISVKKNNCFSWGSGVVVNAQEGIIISCAHVVKDASHKMVEVGFSNGDIQEGFILYQSNIQYETENHHYDIKNNSAWDISVIQMQKSCKYALPLSQELPLVGTSVLNGGHSLFWKDSLLAPTFSLGNLAKIMELHSANFKHKTKDYVGNNYVERPPKNVEKLNAMDRNSLSLYNCPMGCKKSKIFPNSQNLRLSKNFICYDWKKYDEHCSSFPAMLQTTCAVYSGLSGGPVVAVHPYKGPVVIGIVTSCVQSKNVDVLFPHVNMAVPSYFISKAVEKYILSKDTMDFNILSITSPEVVHLCTFKNKLLSRL